MRLALCLSLCGLLFCAQMACAYQPSTADSLRRVIASTTDTAQVNARLKLGGALFSDDRNAARAQYDTARQQALKLKYLPGLSEANIQLGWICYYSGEYLAGAEYVRNGIQQVDTLAKPDVALLGYTVIGAIHLGLESPDSGRYYMLKALSAARRIQHHLRICRTLNNIGVTYYYQKRYADALPYFLRSYEYLLAHPEAGSNVKPLFEVTILYNIGEIYIALRKQKVGVDYINRSIKLAIAERDSFSLATALFTLAEAYDSARDYRSAISYAKTALGIQRMFPFRLREKEMSVHLAALYGKIGDYKNGMFYLRLASEQGDSLKVEETKRKIADLAAYRELKAKEVSISSLRQEKAEASANSARLQALSLALLTGLGVLGFYYFQRNRTARVLADKNTEIQAANQTLRQTLEELRATQEQLIVSEKVAALGRLVANIAHEFNTPISAIRSSSGQLQRSVPALTTEMGPLIRQLSEPAFEVFKELVLNAGASRMQLTTREEREHRRQLEVQLASLVHPSVSSQSGGIGELAQALLALGVHDNVLRLAPLLSDSHALRAITAIRAIGSVIEPNQTIEVAAERLRRIVSALNFFARQDTALPDSRVPISQTLHAALSAYEHPFRNGISLVKNLEWPDPEPLVPQSLEMAWSQLLHNSILAIGYKGTIRLRAVTADGCTQVSIEDSGPGFSKEAQERIFEPFFTTRPKGEGLGLGLYVTQHLVQQAGGTLSITSSAEGAVATITLNRA